MTVRFDKSSFLCQLFVLRKKETSRKTRVCSSKGHCFAWLLCGCCVVVVWLLWLLFSTCGKNTCSGVPQSQSEMPPRLGGQHYLLNKCHLRSRPGIIFKGKHQPGGGEGGGAGADLVLSTLPPLRTVFAVQLSGAQQADEQPSSATSHW